MNRSGLLSKLLIPLLILFAAVYSFSQAVRVPLDISSAEKVLAARNILSGDRPVFSTGSCHPLEIPVYLLCTAVFGLGTYAASAAAVCFFMLLFCAGLWILHKRGLLSPLSCLVWLAVTGMPDSFLLQSIRRVPVLTLSILLFACFFSSFIETRRAGYDIGSGITLILILTSLSLPEEELTYGTIRALLKVFRADFSGQPLLQLSTARYFLNSLILLMLLLTLIRVFAGRFRDDPFILTFTVMILLTVITGFLPVRIGSGQKSFLFTWLPFGGTILMLSVFDSSEIKKDRFLQGHLPVPAAAAIFFAAAAVLNFGPIVTSRPPGTADRAAAILREHGTVSGYCDPKDQALFITASKGSLRLTSDPDDPENRFCILSEDTPAACAYGESYDIDMYRVVILP